MTKAPLGPWRPRRVPGPPATRKQPTRPARKAASPAARAVCADRFSASVRGVEITLAGSRLASGAGGFGRVTGKGGPAGCVIYWVARPRVEKKGALAGAAEPSEKDQEKFFAPYHP